MRYLTAVLLAAFWLTGCNPEPDNPLIGAARSGDAQAVKTLLAHGADPNQRWGVNYWTPLMHAIHKDQRASVEALVAGGADLNARCGDGMTALMMAAGYGYADIVQVLLDHGADPNLEDSNGLPLHLFIISNTSTLNSEPWILDHRLAEEMLRTPVKGRRQDIGCG